MAVPDSIHCSVPDDRRGERISLAHGEGGRLTRQLLRDCVLPALTNEHLAGLGDGAVLPACPGKMVFSADSFVVTPLFFPGGDIGSLAVYGTVNDLAVSGARPRWLSLSLILEEGFPISVLRRVLRSVAESARLANVQIVTGDTKVVSRGAADGLFLNTAGVGEQILTVPGPGALEPSDRILVTGPIGRHGMAVLVAREQLDLDPLPVSDCAPLFGAVHALAQAGVPIKAMRDATRGGVAAVLQEWSEACGQSLAIDADRIPVTPEVRGACELLGLDPLFSACEGTMVVAVPPAAEPAVLQVLRSISVSAGATAIGTVIARQIAPVAIRRSLGQLIPLDEPAGAPLPRIC